MKKLFLTTFVATFGLLFSNSEGALNFSGLGETVTPVIADLNTGIGGANPGFLSSASDGDLAFADGTGSNGPNPSSAFTDLTINNTSADVLGRWAVSLNFQDLDNSFPPSGSVFNPVSLVVSFGGSTQTFNSTNGAFDFRLANGLTGGGSDTLRLAFSSTGPSAPLDFAATVTGIQVTSVVPEPSSAFLLTGILGLFGTFFRKRRRLGLS